MTGQTVIQTKVSESDLEFTVRYTFVSSANQGWDEYCAAGKFQWQMPEDACMHTCQLFEISKSEIARDDPKVTSFCAYFSRMMILPQLLRVRFFS